MPLQRPPAEPGPSQAEHVLLKDEAASRLGMSRGELETMIDGGKIEALPLAGVSARVIPAREVERLLRLR